MENPGAGFGHTGIKQPFCINIYPTFWFSQNPAPSRGI